MLCVWVNEGKSVLDRPSEEINIFRLVIIRVVELAHDSGAFSCEVFWQVLEIKK